MSPVMTASDSEPPDPVVEREAERPNSGSCQPSDAEDEPSAADVVEHRRHLASSAGFRKAVHMTMVPSSTREVASAMADRIVQHS
jgi:hypothetical protein